MTQSMQQPGGADPSYFIVAVEGPIAVGKTTLARKLAQEFQFRQVLESPHANPFLPRFQHRKEDNAFRTQMAFLVDRYKLLAKIGQAELFNRGVITDFTLNKDRIYAGLHLAPVEFGLYQQMYNALAPHCIQPDVIVYLQSDRDALFQSVLRRKLAYETAVTPAFIDELCDAYREWMDRDCTVPRVTIRVDRALSRLLTGSGRGGSGQLALEQERIKEIVDAIRNVRASGQSMEIGESDGLFSASPPQGKS